MCCVQSFDELLLMKRGGRIIFHGPLGKYSSQLVDYFQVQSCRHSHAMYLKALDDSG